MRQTLWRSRRCIKSEGRRAKGARLGEIEKEKQYKRQQGQGGDKVGENMIEKTQRGEKGRQTE